MLNNIVTLATLPHVLLEYIARFVPREMDQTIRATRRASERAFSELYQVYQNIPDIHPCIAFEIITEGTSKKALVLLTANRIFALGRVLGLDFDDENKLDISPQRLQIIMNTVPCKIPAGGVTSSP